MESLSLQKSDYEDRTATFAGWGQRAEWSANEDKAATIRDCVESGLRRFYHCGYGWSFLKPFTSLTLRDGESLAQLPEDFGGLEGRIIVILDGGSYRPIKLMNQGVVEQMFANDPDATGCPQVAALKVKKATGAAGQIQELKVFPTADDEYTLKVQYYVLPNFLDGTHPYAYGGAEHVETILESCLAIMEERYNDISGGPHAQRFEQLMQRSMLLDSRKKPQFVGENRDRSDELPSDYQLDGYFAPVTINGIAYGE